MFRRRRPPAERPQGSGTRSGPAMDAASLAAAGWVLPFGLGDDDASVDRSGGASWTLVGTVDSPVATPVDPRGLVGRSGWSLDWWIGADDRWHLPASEAAVRQDLLADVPVVETRLRIPGGDALHRAYGIRSPRRHGDEWVIVEIENQTPVPFGVALVVRPFLPDGVASVESITIEPVSGGRGRDQAHLVRVDGVPALVLPRRPNRMAVGGRDSGDVAAVVTTGDAGEELTAASCSEGLATMALVVPVPHTAVLRVALPVGVVDADEVVGYPAVVPDAEVVASGWEAHRRGPRFVVPDARLGQTLERARTQVLLAGDGGAVRRDGNRASDLEPGATDLILAAYDVLDRPAEVGAVIARWPDRFAEADVGQDALLLRVVAHHWLLFRPQPLLDWVLPEVAAAVERLDRAERRGRLDDPTTRADARSALVAAQRLMATAGQPGAADAIGALVDRIGPAEAPVDSSSAAGSLAAAARQIAVGDLGGVERLDAALAQVGPTGAWPGPHGPSGRRTGHDLAASAALVLAARTLLVHETEQGLDLIPAFPSRWYGGPVELHDAPTAHGSLSLAVRWHGTRPALLWELERDRGAGPVQLRAPGLDPDWSTTDLRGEALLAEVTPPEGLERIDLVAEHPDIDPAMRRPGEEPGTDGPADDPLPDFGTFS